jgi:tRNA A-37 threonylcarbamoyl transferase component Bud32
VSDPTPANTRPSDQPTVLTPSGDAASGSGSFAPGQSFGDYELIAEIGRGGMGVVWKARQKSLNRIVALKTLLPGVVRGAEALARFRTEAEATARLKHPHIVAVHAVGEVGGQLFYSMDLIEGVNLDQRGKAGPLPGRTAAGYILALARAVHHAHGHGVLHRDLKPSNVLIDADDQPHLTDFGLAKQVGDASLTQTGAVMGTPSYMAPEQASGRSREIGPHSDVYGLGAVLYDLITGRPPFRSDTPLDTLRHVVETEPAPPRLLNPKIDRDLELICLKCLRKDPRNRYATAEELARDLERYLAGEPISARNFNVLDRLGRSLDRNLSIVEFQGYGTMLLIWAGIVLVEHVALFFLMQMPDADRRLWIEGSRGVQFVLMALVFWCYRRTGLLPRSQAERQVWAIVTGYLVSAVCLAGIGFVLKLDEAVHLPDQAVLSFSAALSGLMFVTLGSMLWGRCYLIGVVFFAAAVLMPLHLMSAPLVFGGLWAAALAAAGLHLRRLGKPQSP